MDSDYTTLNWRYNPNWVPISHYVVHPDYNPTSFESVDDIAVVFLNEDLRHKEDILSLCPDHSWAFYFKEVETRVLECKLLFEVRLAYLWV